MSATTEQRRSAIAFCYKRRLTKPKHRPHLGKRFPGELKPLQGKLDLLEEYPR
jgi:hypothetical protein